MTELLKPRTAFLDEIADTKRVGYGDRVQFRVKLDRIRAFIQANGATTPRSRIAAKTVSLETMCISARPAIYVTELLAGRVNMSDLITEATEEMQARIMEQIISVFQAGMVALASPYYATASGVVAATLNPLIRHWQRYGGATILGDIEVIAKIAALTGFAASSTQQQFNNEVINQYHTNGFVGNYLGASVHQIVNPYVNGSDSVTAIPKGDLFILPAGMTVDNRPLKVLFQGDVLSQEVTNIDDKTFEVRLDQHFGAGLVYGEHPAMSLYVDSSF